MTISALFFLDAKGKIIVFRDYRGDVGPKCVDKFMARLSELEETSRATPIILADGITYIYVQVFNLILLAVTRANSNAASITAFLHRLIHVFKHYFGQLEEESLRDNFVIVYELLDEVGRTAC